jgi:hypothetical protein
VVLLCACPAFDFLFARDGVAHIEKNFIVNESEGLVPRCESFAAFSVLTNAQSDVIGNAGVESAPRNAGEHVDEVASFAAHGLFCGLAGGGGRLGRAFFPLWSSVIPEKNKPGVRSLCSG